MCTLIMFSFSSLFVDKKKRRVPRFVFSLKRTGSGKRSRKPNKEVNGIRPTSYPAAKTGEQTSADSARPQSELSNRYVHIALPSA